ncbi:autophagy protein APG17 [Ceratobasidium sp. AG-Ba]|nr:autophagy protein APG17 [Ceratobasidium sp. AG-Ba]
MSATVSPSPPALPPAASLAALFLPSKKALLHGNNVCDYANTLTRLSSDVSVDILTLDAKLRWLVQSVLEQLKAAGSIAKSIEFEQENLYSVAKEWDRARSQRTRSLDIVLEQLGNQSVPPSLHKTVTGSSVFGSPASNTGKELPVVSPGLNGRSLHDTGRVDQPKNAVADQDRRTWKTLRDFIDERSIEEALERVEEERLRLDDSLAKTYDFSPALGAQILGIQESLPHLSSEPVLTFIHQLITEQDDLVRAMAEDLEGIARHFGQVRDAMKVEENGDVINPEDLQTLDQDTKELTAVINDIDSSGRMVETLYEQLGTTKESLRQGLVNHRGIVQKLEQLDQTMTTMLDEQQAAQAEVYALLDTLNSRLEELEDLETTYVTYRRSYARLLQEMARRDRHRAEMEEIVHGTIERLERCREEEIQKRQEFFATEGENIPEDLCPFVADPPARWILTYTGDDDGRVIEDELLEEVCDFPARQLSCPDLAFVFD